MIDLTKPIRRKSTGEKVFIVPGGTYYYVTDKDGYCLYFDKDLGRSYENIPRKPREWSATLDCGNHLCTHISPENSELIRVIEWPKDAPLPDLPET